MSEQDEQLSYFDFSPMVKESATADIVKRIVGIVVSGKIPLGGKLPPERQLAAQLGVGRSSVREALKALDLLGMIEVRQGDGNYLRNGASDLLPQVVEWGLLLNRSKTLDLIETRYHLEIVLVRLAAVRASEPALAAIEACLARMESCDAPTDFSDADAEFHLQIARSANNAILADMLTNIKSLLKVWVLRVIHQSGERATTIDQHRAIYAALRARDPEAAAAAMEVHMASAMEKLKESLQEEESQ